MIHRRLTAAQFMTVWEATGLDRMPYPLRYRVTSATEAEHDRERQALRSWMQRRDPGLSRCIDALRYPQLSITVYAPQTDEASAVVRRASVRGDVSVLAEQLPAGNGGGDGDIAIGANDDGGSRNLEQLVFGLVGELPACAAGTVGALSAHPEDIQQCSSSLLQSTIMSKGELIRRLLGRPRTGIGYICVRGARSGLVEPLLDELTWIDVAGDGRYLYRADHNVHLSPASPAAVYEVLLRRLRAIASGITDRDAAIRCARDLPPIC